MVFVKTKSIFAFLALLAIYAEKSNAQSRPESSPPDHSDKALITREKSELFEARRIDQCAVAVK